MKASAWPVLAGLLVVLGLWLQVPWLVRLGAMVVGVGLLSRAWVALAPRAVTYERSLSSSHVFAGDTVTLTVRLVNDKLLPLAWLRVDDGVPDAVELVGRSLAVSAEPSRASLVHAAALGPYDRLTWHYTIACPTRGIYGFGPVTVETGDPFGLYRRRWARPEPARLVVYPRLVPLTALGFVANAPFGQRPRARALDRDPLRPIGVRPYQPGDSRRLVDWAATARTGQLQVQVLEPVNQEQVMVVLNVATFEQIWIGVDRELQERLIQVAGSIAHHALAGGRPVGLVTNGGIPGGRGAVRVPPGNHPGAEQAILETLAAVGAFVALPVDRLLLRESRRVAWGATLVVVTAVVPESLIVALLRLRRAGRQVSLVSLSETDTALVPGVPTHRLGAAVFDAAFARGAERPEVTMAGGTE